MFELKLFNNFNSRCVFLVKEYCHMLYVFVICMYLDITLSVITYNLMLHVLSILLYMYVCSLY